MIAMADLILIAHLAFVCFVVAGLGAIWLGAYLGRAWARDPVFRLFHLFAILVVAGESLLHISCPLTLWEYELRGDASQTGFLQRWARELLYWNLPGWMFDLLYVGFALLVIWTWVRIPPRLFWRK